MGRQRSAHAGDRRRGNRAEGRGPRPRRRDDLGTASGSRPLPVSAAVLLDELDKLAKTQPEYDRVSVGFPGAIRRGRVREVPAFSRRGPGEGPDPDSSAVVRLRARRRPAGALRPPTRVANDADVQGCAVATGTGGAGDHPRDRRGLRGVLRRRAAAAHGALARPLRRGPVDRGRVRRPPPREDRQQGVAQARDERARHLRGHGAARPHLHRRRQRQAARPGHTRPEPHHRPNISGLLGGIKLWERAMAAPALGDVPTPAKSWPIPAPLFLRPSRKDHPVADTEQMHPPSARPTNGPPSPSTTPPWPRATCVTSSPTTPAASRR